MNGIAMKDIWNYTIHVYFLMPGLKCDKTEKRGRKTARLGFYTDG